MAQPHLIELDEAVSRIKQACEARASDSPSPFFFMVGAGLSYPSVPLAADIVSKCKEVAQSYGRGDEPAEKNSLDTYSHWFQTAYSEPDQRQKYLRELIEGKQITHANFRLAHLLLNHTVSNMVVTTNFDDFLSKALNLFGKPHIVCDHPQTVGRINPTKQILQIVHLHGSYWFYDCCNLRGELEDRAQQSRQTTSTMASLLDMIFWDRSPLIIGYSGWEGDVFMEALRRRLARPLGTNVYWFCRRKSSIASIPEAFRNNPNIRFVVASKQSIPQTAGDAISIEQKIDARQASTDEGETKGLATKRDDEPTLLADTVLAKLIQAFKLEAPDLTRDPLGFYAARLEDSLPKGEASDTDTDIYAIKAVIERVRNAKQIEEEAIKPSEVTLEEVRDAVRRADYGSAARLGVQIQLGSLSANELEELADAMSSTAVGLFDNPEEEISAYDLVVSIRDELSRRQVAENPALTNLVARALYNKGIRLGTLNRSEEAITAYDELLRYGEGTDPTLQKLVARGLRNKGNRLGSLDRNEEAIAVYDEVVRRYGEAKEPALLEQVAKALVNKGFTLGELNRGEEAIVVYDELQQRYRDATEPALREEVAKALFNTGITSHALGRHEDAINAYEEVVRRYGEASEPALRDIVAKALVGRSLFNPRSTSKAKRRPSKKAGRAPIV
jgi:tetratricopeptide (TPR) repeat protein